MRDRRILYVDLSTGRLQRKVRPELNEFLGGAGLATKLLEEELYPRTDALAAEQPIVIAIGPLSTIYPSVTKAVAMFKSPLTGELGESHAGMRISLAMRAAGLDAVVIMGRSQNPCYLFVSDEDIAIRDATPIWGASVEETGRLLREIEPGTGHRSCLRIGPAGERLVRFAGVNVDTFRHFGRLGLGAVFGSKNLKAVVMTGRDDEPIIDLKPYSQMYDELYKKCVETGAMEKYHELGTPVNVAPLSAMGALPTRNLQAGQFEDAEAISGESFAEEKLIRKIACPGCPVGCIHVAMLRKFFGPGYEVESATVSYDYELIFALGSFLGISDKDAILSLIDRVELLGLDAISAGVALGWATEAFAKGLLTEEQLLTQPKFGDVVAYQEVLGNIVSQPNEFYRVLAQGAAQAAHRFGGEEFAAQLGGNEMPGYHTGYGSVIGFTVSARHSHLDNAGYSYDQSHQGPLDIDGLVDYLLVEEQTRCALNSLTICLFARKVYDLETSARALTAVGIPMTAERLMDLGKRIFTLKLRLKEAMGFDLGRVKIPGRYFETPTLNGRLDPQVAGQVLQRYIQRIKEL